jgi:glycosyltransferase involved in cell wall biosynthesis
MKKVVVLTADANTLIYHRGDLIRDFAAHGCEVTTSAAEDYPHVHEFMKSLGGKHRAIRMVRSQINPRRDLDTWLDMWRLFRSEKPEALFAYTIKSVLYGCPIARLAGVPKIYALLPGLGFTFVKPVTWKQKILSAISKALHRFALRRADVIFMQNEDDRQLFTDLNLLPKGVPVHVTAGSGVNLDEFPHAPITETPKTVRFCLVSRLLISKGVRVFAEAARRIRARFPNAEFHLIGPFDPNPNRVEESEVAQWVAEGTLTHHGMVKDVASLIQTMHIFCLPTWYREGVPHATLEALATGRAVITTNSVGAKECVKLTAKGEKQREASESLMEGENGFLCAPQSIDAVEAAMAFYLENPTQIVLHGQSSRQLAADVFDVRLVNDIILRAMQLKGSPRSSEDVSIAEPSSFVIPHSSF